MKPIPRLLSVTSAAMLLTAPALPADAKLSKATPDSGPKTHILFMGLDLDWQQGKELHRVQGIRGRSAIVSVGKQAQTVVMGRDNNTFKVVNSLKLGKPAVRLEQVKLERFYTEGNDPQNRFMEAFALSTAAMDEAMAARAYSMRDQYLVPSLTSGPVDQDFEARRLAEREVELELTMMNISAMNFFTETRAMPAINPTLPKPVTPKSGSVELGDLKIEETDVALPAKMRRAEASKAPPSAPAAGEAAVSPTSSAGPGVLGPVAGGGAAVEAKPARTAAAKPGVVSDSQGQWYDAFELKFEVSSEKLFADPYVVIVLNYIDPQDPSKPRQWVHAQQLEPIGPTPRQISLRHAGFPPGFAPRTPSIHLYDRGRELATSGAGGMALTRDEALDYLLIEYLSTNKRATMAAAPIPASLPEDVATRLQATKFPKDVFVQVSANGLPVEMFADAGRRRRIDDPAVRATIAETRFYPALEKGKPIEGMARLAFDERSVVAGK